MTNQDNGTDKAPDRIERTYYDKGKTIVKEEIPYKNNRIDGIRREYREDGTIYECGYKDGEKNGAEREYFDNGRLKRETFYVNGAAEGPFAVLSFYEVYDGESYAILEAIGRHVRGKCDGLIEYYSQENAYGMIARTAIYRGGKMLRQTRWCGGIRQGDDTCYDASGKAVRTVLYKNGELSVTKGKETSLGPEYDYDSYPDNEAYRKTLPLDTSSPAMYYSTDHSIDGHREIQTAYDIKNGVAEGAWKHYYEIKQGDTRDINRIESVRPYKSGRVHGTVREYYYSGALFSETVYADGEKDGPAKYYEDHRRLMILNRLIPPGKPAKVLYFRKGIQSIKNHILEE